MIFKCPQKIKVGVIAFLSLPIAVAVIGCYRLHTFVMVFSLPSLSAEDPYNVRNALSNIESNLAVIATCGLTIKWLLARFIPYFNSTLKASASNVVLPSLYESQLRGYQKSVDQNDHQDNLELAYPGKLHISKQKIKTGDTGYYKHCVSSVNVEDV